MRLVPFLLPLAVTAVVAVQRWPDASPARVDVAASAPRYTSVGDLVAASDLIVVGRIDVVSPGRLITDPADPGAGIRTQLAALSVDRVLKGPPTVSVVVEEEAALLDGTAITVDGMAPTTAGARGVFFLIGDRGQTGYYALIGSQGRFLIEGQRLLHAAEDPLSTALAAGGLDGLLRLLEAARAEERA